MTRRPPLLRALVTALLFAAVSAWAAPIPKEVLATAASIESNSGALVGVPGLQRPEDQVSRKRLEDLKRSIVDLFSVKDQDQVAALFSADKKLLPALSAVYSDARYAPDLPPIPAEFQRWLGRIQVGQAIQ